MGRGKPCEVLLIAYNFYYARIVFVVVQHENKLHKYQDYILVEVNENNFEKMEEQIFGCIRLITQIKHGFYYNR